MRGQRLGAGVDEKEQGHVLGQAPRLPANGSYQYRYLVNNAEWINDEAADSYAPNEHGTTNSVVETYSVN